MLALISKLILIFKGDCDTVIFPLLEMGPLGIHIDSTVTMKILEKCNEDTDVYLTTGYFNLTDFYRDTIINMSKARYKILMAHPTVSIVFPSIFMARKVKRRVMK